jgi:hypothetical protein
VATARRGAHQPWAVLMTSISHGMVPSAYLLASWAALGLRRAYRRGQRAQHGPVKCDRTVGASTSGSLSPDLCGTPPPPIVVHLMVLPNSVGPACMAKLPLSVSPSPAWRGAGNEERAQHAAEGRRAQGPIRPKKTHQGPRASFWALLWPDRLWPSQRGLVDSLTYTAGTDRF